MRAEMKNTSASGAKITTHLKGLCEHELAERGQLETAVGALHAPTAA